MQAPVSIQAEAARTGPPDRAAIVRLHEARKPWALVPMALRSLEDSPDDVEIRGLLVTHFLQLGLTTPAKEHAQRLPQATGAALVHAAAKLPHDQVSPAAREQTLRQNMAMLGSAAVQIEPFIPGWLATTAPEQWLRCSDGTIVARPAEGSLERAFTIFDDAAGFARSLPLRAPEAVAYLDGLAHAAVLSRLVAISPRQADGFWPRIVVVEPAIDGFLRCMAASDLRAVINAPRFEWFVGDGALERLGAWLRGRIHLALAGPVVPGQPPAAARPSAVESLVRRACSEQEREAGRVSAVVRSAERVRDRAWWAERYAKAAAGRGEPLRVLVSTTRFSTFVQHSARDIGAAFEAHGCRVEVLIEPDDASKLTNVAAGQAIERLNPDLIVCINYHRRNLGAMAPPDIPYVCWVQDAMGHLFSKEEGAALGPTDFVVGHLHAEFFDRFAYPRARALALPVLASAEKFHDGPVAPELAAPFECEVAVITNQSETPERLRERVLRANAARPEVCAIVQRLYPVVEQIVANSGHALCMDRLRSGAEEELRAATGGADAATLAVLINHVALPLADRMLRHRVLQWAAAICDARAWRLHIYGQGWDRHPTLARFAKGVVEHGEHLRAAYQGARATLHASVNWNLHQRVFECALSGGLPITLRKRDDLVLLEWCAARSISLHTPPPGWLCDLGDRRHWGCAADHPHAMMLVAQCQRLGLPHDGRIPWDPAHWLAHGTHGWGGALAPEAVWLMGDMAETTFADPAELERVLDMAVHSDARRANLAAGIRSRVRAHLTYESAAPVILNLIASSLGAKGAQPAQGGSSTP
ncbi:MAG: hypothetical protein ACKVS8_06125 [Phycisphaerales bacterium]